MKIYLIPGLAFTDQVFKRIKIPDQELNYLNWIEPLKNESIKSYANRMAAHIAFDEEEITLIGHSFGGMMAQEIARQKKVAKVILISSIVSEKENPFAFKIIKPFFIHKMIGKRFFLNTFRFWAKHYGYQTADEQALFRAMVGQQSDYTLEWSLKNLSLWKNDPASTPTKIVRIHGTKDYTLPFELTRNIDYEIKDGSHILVYSQAEMVSDILKKEILLE